MIRSSVLFRQSCKKHKYHNALLQIKTSLQNLLLVPHCKIKNFFKTTPSCALSDVQIQYYALSGYNLLVQHILFYFFFTVVLNFP